VPQVQGRRAPEAAGQLPNSVFDLLNTVNRGDQWDANDGWQQQPPSGDSFDLSTGGDQSAAGSASSSEGRSSERNILAPARADRKDAQLEVVSGLGHASSAAAAADALDNRPRVPTSTTTPAPEFVMINPTRTQA
jgi:hypothetical protein